MSKPDSQEIYDNEGHINYDKVVEIVHINLKNFLDAILEESFALAADDKYRIQINETTRKICDQALDSFIERRHVVISEFYVELESRFYTSNSVIMRPQIIDHSTIQTVDTDLIELTLAIDNLIDRSIDRHADLINQLELQLEELFFLAHQEFNIYCLHPQDFYKLFQNCIAPLNIPVDGKILISKLLYQNISPNLNDFYTAMHQFLLDIDIQPVERTLNKNVVEENSIENEEPASNSSIMNMTTGQFFAPVEQELWGQESETQQDFVDEHINKSAQVLNTKFINNTAMDVYGPGQTGLDEVTISLLLQPYSPGTQSNSSPAQRRQFVRALSRVQKAETASNAVFQANQIKKAVKRTLHEKGAFDAVEIVENEEKVIDFVSNIFQVILDDDSLCDAIKALLARLQISIIKLALIDFTFFQNSRHPARQMLNKLTSLGIRITGKEEQLFKELKLIIKNITDNFDTDVQVFDHALNEINRLDAKLNHSADYKTIGGNKHKLQPQRSAAKRVVIHTIKKFTVNKEIPNPILGFCLKCWAPHMAYIYMNHGRSTREWRNSVRILRRIIEVSQNSHSLNEILQFIHEPNQFFEDIRKDLEHFHTQSEEFKEALEEAEVWYLTYLRKIDQEAEELTHQDQAAEMKEEENDNGVQQDNVIHLFKNLSSHPEQEQEINPETETTVTNLEESPKNEEQTAYSEQGSNFLEAEELEELEELENSKDLGESSQEEVHDDHSPGQFDSEMKIEDDEFEEEPELSVEEHLPESITPGVWLEIFQGEDKAKRRLKFSSANSETKQLFFIDRSGDYRFEIDLETFLDDLSTGRSSLISESNRFDLALSSVINNIRSSQDKAGSN